MLPHRTPRAKPRENEGRQAYEHAPAQDQWQEQGDRRPGRRGRGRRRRTPAHRHGERGGGERRVHQDQRLVDRLHRPVRRHQQHHRAGEVLDAGVRPAGRGQAVLAVERRVERQRTARHRASRELGHPGPGPGRVGDRRLRGPGQRRPDGLPDRRRPLLHRRRPGPRAERPPDPEPVPGAHAHAHQDVDAHPHPDHRHGHHRLRRLRPLRGHLPLPGLRPARRRQRHRGEDLQPGVRHRRRRLHPQVGRGHRSDQRRGGRADRQAAGRGR
ncbi:hypothetical protein SGPA1_30216 [Streptomyces misionensis JCM 4497]